MELLKLFLILFLALLSPYILIYSLALALAIPFYIIHGLLYLISKGYRKSCKKEYKGEPHDYYRHVFDGRARGYTNASRNQD